MARVLRDPEAVLIALALSYRTSGRRIGPSEIEQVSAVLRRQSDWSDEDFLSVVQAIFAKRPDERADLAQQLAQLLESPDRTSHRSRPETSSDVSARLPLPPPGKPKPLISFWAPLARLWANPVISTSILLAVALLLLLLAILLTPGASDAIMEIAAEGSSAVVNFVQDPMGTTVPPEAEGGSAIVVVAHHAVTSAFLAGFVLLVVIIVRRVRHLELVKEDGPSAEVPGSGPTIKLQDDGSEFRVGALGGAPPPFLTPLLANAISDAFTYRQTEPDFREFDVNRTIDRRSRGDADALAFAPSKELPTVIIVADELADGAYWNTLAQEFDRAIDRRGLRIARFSYSGNLLAVPGTERVESMSAALAIETQVANAGWAVLIAFVDVRRLSGREIEFFRSLREAARVILVDYQDPRLWDYRHRRVLNQGLTLVAATGKALHAALDERLSNAQAGPSRRGDAIGTTAAVPVAAGGIDALSDAHREWAAACALVQPISFALAEQLRKAHPKLAGPDEVLAYSLLAALNGSWTGPEGIRFSPSLHRKLLVLNDKTPFDRQAAFQAGFDEAFGAVPVGTTASELWKYARARAAFFSGNQGAAEEGLRHALEVGLVDPASIGDFLGRMTEGRDAASGGISPPFMTRRLASLINRWRFGRESVVAAGDVSPATWSVGLAEVRVSIGETASPSSHYPILSVFLSDGLRLLTIRRAATSAAEAFQLSDASRGKAIPMTVGGELTDWHPGDIVDVIPARQRDEGVVVMGGGQLYRFAIANEAGWQLSLTPIENGSESRPRTPDDQLTAVTDDGTLVATALRDTALCFVTDLRTRSRRPLDAPGPITALAFANEDLLLIGLADGTVAEVRNPAENAAVARTSDFSSGAPVVALATTSSADGGGVVAARADGRLELSGNRPVAGPRVPWKVRSIVAFVDREAGVRDGIAVGVSAAVFGSLGEFDIFGLVPPRGKESGMRESLMPSSIRPSDDGLVALDVHLERRRLAVRNDTRIEIRPLIFDLPEVDEVLPRLAETESRAPLSAGGSR